MVKGDVVAGIVVENKNQSRRNTDFFVRKKRPDDSQGPSSGQSALCRGGRGGSHNAFGKLPG
jgi:hypothetical protein